MLKHFVAWLLVIVAMVAITAGLGFYKYNQIQAGIAAGAAFPEPVQAVGSAEVRKGTWSLTTRAIGTVVAIRQVEIRNELAGVISEMGFQSGAPVKSGQLLVKFDTRQEEASLAAAEAEARLAKTILERRESLRNSPAFSEQELDRAREEHIAAVARARSLAVTIDKKRILAPFDGQIGITDLQPGTYLDAGTRITMLQGTSEDAYIDFSLPQDSAALIRPGTKVDLVNEAIPGGRLTAGIVAEDNSVDRNNRTVLFRASAPGLGRLLRPGMFIDVVAVTAPPRDVLLVPLTALRRSATGAHVFLIADVDGKTRAEERRVEIGAVQNDDVVILNGLELGQRVATVGSFKLREGALVSTEPAAAATPETGSTVN
ncbi:MAG: efflux RND transporter periplasmic adaptor subunit [Hyphomicrobium sp.]|nr:efflux RND transporter periplasmic adaptor subunit [Hyphomicrobium sp.]